MTLNGLMCADVPLSNYTLTLKTGTAGSWVGCGEEHGRQLFSDFASSDAGQCRWDERHLAGRAQEMTVTVVIHGSKRLLYLRQTVHAVLHSDYWVSESNWSVAMERAVQQSQRDCDTVRAQEMTVTVLIHGSKRLLYRRQTVHTVLHSDCWVSWE